LALAPACAGCGFINAKFDRFCGGCATSLGRSDSLTTAAAVRGMPVRKPPSKPSSESTIPLDVIEEV